MREIIIPFIAAWLAAFSVPGKADEIPALRLMAITELKANNSGHFVTQASINGQDIQVLVDTGATAVALSYEDAQTVGLRPSQLDFSIPVSTANGLANAAKVTIGRISIDNIEIDDVSGLVLPEGALRGTLLGMSFLGRLDSFKIEDGTLYLKD